MPAATQLLNVQRGTNEIALDLSAQQATTLKGNASVTRQHHRRRRTCSRLQINMDPKIVGRCRRTRRSRRRSATARLRRHGAARPVTGAVQAAGHHPVDVPRHAARHGRRSSGTSSGPRPPSAASGIADPSIDADLPERHHGERLTSPRSPSGPQADLQAIGIEVEARSPAGRHVPAEVRRGQGPDGVSPTGAPGLHGPQRLISCSCRAARRGPHELGDRRRPRARGAGQEMASTARPRRRRPARPVQRSCSGR